MKDLKYLVAYIAPGLTFMGLYLGGLFTFSGVLFGFVVIPFLDIVVPQSKKNLSKQDVENKLSKSLFDILLYLNLPIVWGMIAYFLYGLMNDGYSPLELTGNMLSIGLVMGASGINVAHELGHRFKKGEQLIAQGLLLPSLYMHFYIEHNIGHHKHVATLEDPSTARYNESIYVFWIRSTWQSYVNAWRLERRVLSRDGRKFWNVHNRMIHFTFMQTTYLVIVFIFTSWIGLWAMLTLGIFSFLLLETINYIEHYGILRAKKENGDYERVRPIHSWNSNHELGRLVLYELTRHSDHHYMASKKYQILDHHEDALQLPYGYPASMMISLVPPVWFKLMNKHLDKTE